MNRDEENQGTFGPMACGFCGKPTSRATLNNYGARCFGCYERYVREPQPAPSWMADKRTEGPKAWAKALKAHDAGGGSVSPVQREMYRRALRIGTEDDGEPA